MGVSIETFYDPDKIAILPMGFCFPGTGKSGDLPPRPECDKTWHEQLMAQFTVATVFWKRLKRVNNVDNSLVNI
jgi:uracil-DNA glycosylase